MSEYDINIKRLIKEGEKGNIKTEIWAEMTNKNTCETMNKRIWWEDEDGVFHDGTPDLPIELRGDVDNAWIEKRRIYFIVIRIENIVDMFFLYMLFVNSPLSKSRIKNSSIGRTLPKSVW